MKINVSQIYTEVGCSYPFSSRLQAFLSEALSERTEASKVFILSYAPDFALTFNVSAKSGIASPEIKGPAVFRRTKDVEFTIFLPHDGDLPSDQAGYRGPLQMLVSSIVVILRRLEIDASRVLEDGPGLIDRMASDPAMIS